MLADARGQPGDHGEPAGHLAEVDEGDGVDGVEVVADLAAVAEGDAGVAGAELPDMGADGAGVGDHPAEEPAEEPGAARQRGQSAPGAADMSRGRAWLKGNSAALRALSYLGSSPRRSREGDHPAVTPAKAGVQKVGVTILKWSSGRTDRGGRMSPGPASPPTSSPAPPDSPAGRSPSSPGKMSRPVRHSFPLAVGRTGIAVAARRPTQQADPRSASGR